MSHNHNLKRRGVLTFLYLMALSLLAAGQSPRLQSPELLPNHQLTFRLYAPGATQVAVTGEWAIGQAARHDLVKRDSGVWSVTFGPVKPEVYGYYFIVDGAIVLDPGNPQVRRDGARNANLLLVPGKESELYAVNDVPHGNLQKMWYPSPTLGLTRRMYVYTPRGYESTTGSYPVFYLLHGGGGDEDAWTTMGRATQIFDNLIAQGKAKPMIVVMTNGNYNQTASQDYASAPNNSQGSNRTGGPFGDITKFPQSLVQDVVPYIDMHFRTRTDRDHRAIAGLSMGGAQTFYAAFHHLDEFSWVGSFSGGFPLLPGVAINITPPSNAASLRGPDVSRSIDPVKFEQIYPQLNADANSKLHLLYVGMGMDDGLITTHAAVKQVLKDKGVRYTLVEIPGYGHEWSFWRICLADYFCRLFQGQP